MARRPLHRHREEKRSVTEDRSIVGVSEAIAILTLTYEPKAEGEARD